MCRAAINKQCPYITQGSTSKQAADRRGSRAGRGSGVEGRWRYFHIVAIISGCFDSSACEQARGHHPSQSLGQSQIHSQSLRAFSLPPHCCRCCSCCRCRRRRRASKSSSSNLGAEQSHHQSSSTSDTGTDDSHRLRDSDFNLQLQPRGWRWQRQTIESGTICNELSILSLFALLVEFSTLLRIYLVFYLMTLIDCNWFRLFCCAACSCRYAMTTCAHHECNLNTSIEHVCVRCCNSCSNNNHRLTPLWSVCGQCCLVLRWPCRCLWRKKG